MVLDDSPDLRPDPQDIDLPGIDSDNESNFLNEIISEVTDYVQGEEGPAVEDLISERRSILDQEMARPTDPDVIVDAREVLIRVAQEKRAKKLGIEDADPEYIKQLSVEFDIKEPESVIIEFGLALEAIHDELIERVDERTGDDKVNPIINTEPETMTQIVGEPKVGAYNDLTILHGSRNIIYNLCEMLDYNEQERDLVQLAHRVAARKNGLHRFVIVNDIVMIDTTLSQRIENNKVPTPEL